MAHEKKIDSAALNGHVHKKDDDWSHILDIYEQEMFC